MALGDITQDAGGYQVETVNGPIHVATIEEAYALTSPFGDNRSSTPRRSTTSGGAPPPPPQDMSAPPPPPPASYPQQIATRVDDFYHGTAEEQNRAMRGQPGKYLQDSVDTEQRLVNPNAVPGAVRAPNAPPSMLPPAGALETADRTEANARSQQQGFVDQYGQAVNGAVDQYGNHVAALDASANSTLDQLIAAAASIQAPGFTAASSNPSDVARQNLVFSQLQGAAGGSLDAHANPQDIANQNLALAKLLPLTDMQETAQERFLMERARQGEEMDRRGAMTAELNNLAMRGMLGSGHEIGAMLGSQQITSQNRMLQDLGAEANAIERQMKALGMYSDLSTNMRNEGFSESNANMGRRAGAMEASGNLATSMRDASDVMARFNQAQAQQNGQFGADFNWKKAQGVADTGLRVNETEGNRAQSVADRSIAAASDLFGAKSGLTSLDLANGNNKYVRDRQAMIDGNEVLRTAWAGDEAHKAAASLDDNSGFTVWDAVPYGTAIKKALKALG